MLCLYYTFPITLKTSFHSLDAALRLLREMLRPALTPEPPHPHAHGRAAARLRRLQQGDDPSV